MAQETFPVNGTHNENHNYYYFTNATIHVDFETTIEKASLLVQNGYVVAVGADIEKPKGSVKVDLKGKHIYPSFIDPYSNYGMPKIEKKKRDWSPQIESKKEGAFTWNQALNPEVDAAKLFKVDAKTSKELRANGFGAVLTHQMDGIIRGTSTGVLTGDGNENKMMIAGYSAAMYSFKKGSSTQDYPGSLMGAIALLRQTYYDAEWYMSLQNENEYNLGLDAFLANQTLPQIFAVTDYLSAVRADRIGDEFGMQYVIKGSGDEYKNIKYVQSTNAAFILPLNFPKAYDVTDLYDALIVTTEDMKHWELAPTNPAIFEQNNIPFAFTADGLKKKESYLTNIRKAIKNGLSETYALKAMTYNPASLIGLDRELGTLEPGRIANFLITSDNIFKDDSKIYENWVKGEKYIIKDMNVLDLKGTYSVNVDGKKYMLTVTGADGKFKGSIKNDTTKIKTTVKLDGQLIAISFTADDETYNGLVSLSGKVNFKSGIWDGRGQVPGGGWVKWGAIKQKEKKEEGESGEEKADSISILESQISNSVWLPNMAFGFDSMPTQQTVLIENATVWTNDSVGILKNASVLIQDGKIAAVGSQLKFDELPRETIKIDAKGKHVTPGIIDEHSHIAISRGVNECTQAVTAEVSIGDVVNSDDINIYRQLAGGVTASQLLHGSCNPIGGQSALIKLRWGASPEEMKIKGTDGFIKFALGENVKQSNHGDASRIRFPQTRMGVEQVYYNAFTRAQEYELEWSEFFLYYDRLKKKEKDLAVPPRKDLELDALVQIMNERRFISCHSYQQSEINMLMHIGDSMGFRVNTFTHILEGYKVAEKMKAHGAGGSTFSDWWAYKYEVNDAIPYNGALMHQQGIVTAYNSDDAEMGRRLNQEAAKAVKYGGVSEEEALKFVTLNPAILLHLDHRMGSITVGKDADIVLWTDHPLSVYARAEKTFIDGICYYDAQTDLELRKREQAERARLIAKMLAAKKGGAPTQKPVKKEQKLYHCDTVDSEY
ncbi:MAG: amidohydrolase family protein [Flavobacteriales bacterium]|nr:amidohydrolase family protein [Flavobacteriales bacterium]